MAFHDIRIVCTDRRQHPSRELVVDLLLSVHVLRTKPGARTFDPACVRLVWKVGQDFPPR